eukprot:TRINITY_DN781_c0_g1_i6.p2 TRINITY_DN781_c0_g1~~TRINITY_DN781_c0_g1_i6.p2  ORF type:complete len:124 (-),score=43.43 TRINITY_DN781_c0_g1_i6:105-476(-)
MAKAANLLLSGILAALFISADALKPCSDQDLDHIEELKRDSPTFTLHSPGPWEGKQQKHIPVLAAGGGRTLHFKVPHPTSSDHFISHVWAETQTCLLYTSDAADEEDSVDLGGRRIIKKKKRK